jgi:hypothetical protein
VAYKKGETYLPTYKTDEIACDGKNDAKLQGKWL